MPGYVMNEELKRTVQQVCLQFLNSFQPRPKRGRRQRRGGGGSTTVEVGFRTGRVKIFIPAADNCHAPGWKVVENAVSLLDDATGQEIDVAHPITVTNKIPTEFPVDAWVRLTGNEIHDGTCFAMPPEFWESVGNP